MSGRVENGFGFHVPVVRRSSYLEQWTLGSVTQKLEQASHPQLDPNQATRSWTLSCRYKDADLRGAGGREDVFVRGI